MKKRVRIYKAQEGGQGQYVSPLSNFMAKAQTGMEQQADPQQIISQVAALVAPPPYGEGQDPQQIYQTLAQSYGEETASQIISAAAAYVQQMVGENESSGEQQQQVPQSTDLNYQQEIIDNWEEQQEEDYNNAIVNEDEAAFDEMLFTTNPALEDDDEEEEMRLGGAKKQFVKRAVKLAKKALGDAGTQNSNKANSTDILDGREKKSSDFLTTIQNQATLALVQKQAENIANSMFKPSPQFQQMGGFTGQDLFKFVYGGGDDPSIPDVAADIEEMAFGGRRSRWNSALYNEAMDYNQESNPYYITDINAKKGMFGRLKNYNMHFAPRPEEQGFPYSGYYSGTGMGQAPDATSTPRSVPMFTGSNMTAPGSRMPKAQAGIEIKDSKGNVRKVTQEEADIWAQAQKDNPAATLDDMSFASQSPITPTTNWKNWNNLITQGYGNKIGDYREGIDYSQVNTGAFNNSGQSKSENPYDQFNMDPYRTGTMWDVLLPNNGIFNKTYTVRGTNMGSLNPRDLMKQGFNMDKQRMGLGHKRYTFTPAGSDAVTAQNKNQVKQDKPQGEFWNKVRGLGFAKDAGINDRQGLDLWNRMRGMFGRAGYMAYGGMPEYQGNVSGSSVNTQQNLIPELKPKSTKEVWDKVYPELLEQPQYAATKEAQNKDLIQDPSLTIDEQKTLNGENFLNLFNPAMRGITKGIETFNQRGNTRRFQENLDAINQSAAVDPQFRGNYDPNSGLFRQDQMGQLWQSAEGGQRRKTGQQSDWGLGIFPTAMGGSDINQYMGIPQTEVKDSLSAVPRDEANLEAEGGETAFGDINGDGFPEHMKIVGPRHSSGGVPLNLPDDTFIFSDTRSMKISDPKILKMFNKPPKKGGYTPAELAKPYDINKYRTILADPESDVIARKTAELMIKNYNVKLGALALAQESKKGFPQGIPLVARPYMEMMGLKDEDIIPQEEEQQNPAMMQQAEMSPDEMAMMQQTGEMGMPPVDQMAMDQEDMSGAPMEGMPMAAYGMSMGGYGMPFAQDGMETFNPLEQLNNRSQEEIDKANEAYYERIKDLEGLSFFKKNPGEGNFSADTIAAHKMGYLDEPWFNMGLSRPALQDYYNSFKGGQWHPNQVKTWSPGKKDGGLTKGQDGMFVDYLNEQPVSPNMSERDMRISQKPYYHVEPQSPTNPEKDRYWLTAGDRLRNLRSFITGEEPELRGGVSYQFQDGGAKSKNRTYTEDDLPADAVVKSPYSTDIRIGDFIKQKDGTYVKVTKANFKASEVDTKTRPGTAADFYNASPENKAIMDNANAIIEREIAKGTIKKVGPGKINILGTLNLPFKEQIALSRAINSNAEFGTNKYKIASQKATPGYSAGPGKGSFVAGFNPEIYEQRYIFEKARGQGATDDEAFAELERVLADPKAKAKLRREYTAFLGMTNIPTDDAELLSPNFYKNRYGEVTKGLENTLAKSSNRPALGDDLWAGYEHFDALGLKPEFQYEGMPEEEKKNLDQKDENDIAQDEEVTTPYRGDAPWWLQDQIKMAGAFGDLMSINKYYPWAPKYNPVVPEPAFLDPTRAIAAQAEQAKILGDTMAQFSPSAPLAAGRISGLQGQLAKGVADTTHQYDTANVQIANQYGPAIADIYNKAQLYNQGVSKQLYDANTILNQQYDNSKRALRNNLLNQYTNAVTNRWKTDALNQMYPQFAVDPSVGGQMYYTGQEKPYRPEDSKSLADLYREYYDATGDREAAQKFAMLQYKQNQSGYNNADLYPAEAMMSLYDNMKEGGVFVFGPSLMPPFIL